MIEFEVKGRWEEADVAKRVALIIGQYDAYFPEPICPFVEDGKWQLDCGNNWWLHKVESKKYTLSYRYTTKEKQVALDGLKIFLETMVFGN